MGFQKHRGFLAGLIAAALCNMFIGVAADAEMAGPAAAPTAHTVVFQNNCAQPIWIATNGNINPPVTPISSWELAPKCGPNYTCPTGSKCVGGACTCTKPNQSDPACAGGLCQANKSCATSVQASIPLTFSGRFWGRTGCSASATNCITGDCGSAACNGKGANDATLWEETLTGTNTAFPGTPDNYDVSLVSGYNVSLDVQSEIPANAPGWSPKSVYHNGQKGNAQSVIVAPAGSYQWLFNDVGPGATATSGTTMPKFSPVLRNSVSDGAEISWSTTSSVCQTGTCATDLLLTCPPLLRVDDPQKSCKAGSPSDPKCAGGPCDSNGTCIVACTVPVNYCAGPNPNKNICTTANKSFYACLNLTSTEADPFGNPINLESANSGNAICFNASDCEPGTTCLMNPTFTMGSKVKWPTGAGICVPGNGVVTQNGGCTDSSLDGNPCPANNYIYPFPDYTCATLTNAGNGMSASTCIPPIIASSSGAAAFGDLIWDADNWTPISPARTCIADSGCSTGERCLDKNVRQAKNGNTILAQAVNECLGAGHTCVCNKVKYCAAAADCTGGTQCLDSKGATCPAHAQCICQTAGIYTGVCGPTNQNWTAAINEISANGSNYLDIFKNACPSAYSFQYDDQASDWSCYSTATQVVNYSVTFCGIGGKGQ